MWQAEDYPSGDCNQGGLGMPTHCGMFSYTAHQSELEQHGLEAVVRAVSRSDSKTDPST